MLSLATDGFYQGYSWWTDGYYPLLVVAPVTPPEPIFKPGAGIFLRTGPARELVIARPSPSTRVIRPQAEVVRVTRPVSSTRVAHVDVQSPSVVRSAPTSPKVDRPAPNTRIDRPAATSPRVARVSPNDAVVDQPKPETSPLAIRPERPKVKK